MPNPPAKRTARPGSKAALLEEIYRLRQQVSALENKIARLEGRYTFKLGRDAGMWLEVDSSGQLMLIDRSRGPLGMYDRQMSVEIAKALMGGLVQADPRRELHWPT